MEKWLEDAKDLIVKNEGIRAKMYRCENGFATIGVGHNLDTTPITKDAIEMIFNDDVQFLIEMLNVYVPWWMTKSHKVRMVLLDVSFNLGIAGLLKFKRMLSHIENDNYMGASAELLNSRYAKQVPKRANHNAMLLRNFEV